MKRYVVRRMDLHPDTDSVIRDDRADRVSVVTHEDHEKDKADAVRMVTLERHDQGGKG